MYTQCPECDVAFRVTADVLKQAAGKVRCGGCGIAFNALAHLSEEMPAAPATEETAQDEFVITNDEPAELEAGTPPKTISAEQSVALLKTLDQLAGEDVRIEDTGVEWRVMSEDDDEDEFADDPVPESDHEEMRFDDNTPLPDDFDLDTPSTLPPPISIAPDPEPEPEPEPQLDASQTNLAFGDPDEWEDLLDDLDEAVEAAESAIEDGAEPLDIDTQFALQAEELGLDISGVQPLADASEAELDEEPEEEPEEAEIEVEEPEERETSIEEDLIAAAFEVEAAARQDVDDEVNLEHVNPDELSRAGILDEDDYLKVITEEDEAEVLDEIIIEDSEEDRRLAEEVLDDEPGVKEEEFEEIAAPEEELVEEEAELEEEEAEELEELVEVEELEDELPNEEDLAADLEEALAGLTDEEDEEDEEYEEIEFAEPLNVEVPEPTEEERTINMMIDQDLLAIAEEDDDGFTSTIVQKQVSSSDDIPSEDDQAAAADAEDVAEEAEAEEASIPMPPQDDNPLMETIIMEGESVLNEEDAERLEAARIAAAASLKESGFDEEQRTFRDWRLPRHSMAAAAALLFVILIIQVVHQSREALAVSPAFQNTIGPVYRMIGNPITPAWDVKGWRFEATKGDTDESGDVLTIYSRVGNNSNKPLPYPLVHVSLTDRFEEIIGSRILEPSEYLVDGADPSRAVRPKDTFDAVIAIDSPSAAATSFKLNVCYRLESGQLRCADKDFR